MLHVTGSEATAAPPADRVPALSNDDASPTATTTATAALHLLAPASLLILLISVLLVLFGPSEALETRFWIIAFAVALPGGMVIAARQARDLDEARIAWAIAAATLVLSAALLLRRAGSGDTAHHLLLALAAAAALAAPWLVRRITPGSATAGYATAMVVLAVTAVLFIPDGALVSGRLIPALVLGGIALVALLATAGREPPRRLRLTIDVLLAGTLALVVMSLPNIRAVGYVMVHHQGFYLGPVNAVMHGQAMLDGTWSQYGTAVMDALRLLFAAIPLGYGGISLIVGVLTAAQYALVYATLRLAIQSQLLVFTGLAAVVVAHPLGSIHSYLAFPSTSPLRFGLPYLVIILGVLGARFPRHAHAARVGALAVLAVSAVWSFETFLYTATTFGLIVLVTELAGGPGAPLRILRRGVIAVAVAVASIVVYTGLTVVLSGGADWGPYIDYIRLYTVSELGELPIVFFSPGPLMGAVIFCSVVGTIHLARTRSPAANPTQLVALAGFSGATLAFFTYYLGRSHPSNLLNILLPVVVLGCLWSALLLQARPSPPRIAALGAVLTAAGMLAVMGWPLAKIRWLDSAFAQTVPYADGHAGGKRRSVIFALQRMWDQPVFDARAESGAALLDRRLKPGSPALVITEPDLTTEILIRAGRRNLLPITNPIQDDLIDSSDGRVRSAATHVPAGTLMLTTPAPKVSGQTGSLGGNPLDLVGVQFVALQTLRARFAFDRVDETPDGLQLVRLRERGVRDNAPAAPQRKSGTPTP
jgi:hypothetical protein